MMPEEEILFHFRRVMLFKKEMFSTLLFAHHLATKTAKMFYFLGTNEEKIAPVKGFLLEKENKKYLLPSVDLGVLPLRVLAVEEQVITPSREIVYVITSYRSFRIVPEKFFSVRELFSLDGIKHPDEKLFTFFKCVAFASVCGRRLNCVISGSPEVGKTSYFTSLGMITNHGNVLKQPRSIGGIMVGLVQNGFVALDELGALTSEQRRVVSSFLFQQGELNPIFRTGVADNPATHFRAENDISGLSCIILTNLVENYKERELFFTYLFENSAAINSRFLPFRVQPVNCGEPTNILDTRQFTLDGGEYRQDHRELFLKILKTLEFYRREWDSLVDWRMVDDSIERFGVTGRHYHTLRELVASFYLLGSEEFYEMVAQAKLYHDWFAEALNNPLENVEYEEVGGEDDEHIQKRLA